ncbi:SPOR domain-containing protein [Desulfobacterales bacterium HSG2]|nr:SPOR domain-containing protein [Desulfobacterales bacterium HSG2]
MKKNGKKQSARGKKNSSLLTVCKGLAKWSLAFLYSAWVFVLGILVGRETSPVKFDIENLQKELVELKEAVIKEEERRFKIDQETLHKKVPDLVDNLKSSETDVSLPPAAGVAPPEEPDDKEMPEKSDEKKSVPEKSASETKKEDASEKTEVPEKTALKTKKKDISKSAETPQQTKKEETAKVSRKAETDDSEEKADDVPKNITLQVASYRKLEDADRMVAELKKKGYPAYVAVGKISDKGTFFRVRVGHFKSKATGRSMKNRLRKDKLKSYFTNIRR